MLLSFEPIRIPELRDPWLAHHEDVLRSSLATVRRYRTASEHLVCFVAGVGAAKPASHFHAQDAEAFAAYLRRQQVAPNGHPNAPKRGLRDKGIKFILDTCRAMFNYAAKRRHLSPYAENPFPAIEIDRIPVEDAKPFGGFTDQQEQQFLGQCDDWQFPIFITLLLTGLRPGELTHLLWPDDLDLEGNVMYASGCEESLPHRTALLQSGWWDSSSATVSGEAWGTYPGESPVDRANEKSRDKQPVLAQSQMPMPAVQCLIATSIGSHCGAGCLPATTTLT
jgi:hypothetical protein